MPPMFLVVFMGGLLIGMASGILLLFWWAVPHLENAFIFRPSKDVFSTPEQAGIPFDQCYIETPDGVKLSGWHLCPTSPAASVIYFHGNGGNLGLLIGILKTLYNHQLQVLAVDYRGYGLSSGQPSEQGMYIDAVATVDFFNRHFKKDGTPLAYWGRSLGSCAAAYAAGKRSPDALVLETAFASKTHLLEHFRHFRPFAPFSRCRLETIRYLEGHTFPILLIHGNEDRTIPLEQGRILYDQLDGPKTFYEVPGGGHLNLHMVDSSSYINQVLSFLAQARSGLNQEPRQISQS